MSEVPTDPVLHDAMLAGMEGLIVAMKDHELEPPRSSLGGSSALESDGRGDDALAAMPWDSISAETTTTKLEHGAVVGRYVVLQQLGAGAMGVVYAAYDPELDRKVALKLVLPGTAGPNGRARLLREAQTLGKLSHPNVVTIHDVGTVGEQVWLAMEFVRGLTLREWLATPHGWREVMGIMLEAGKGLAAAHAAELLHRDFKPDNVMIADDGRVRVMDFGLARMRSHATRETEDPVQPKHDALALQVTRQGALLGTPSYMAPEQFEGVDLTPAADQFSFCVTLWEALYGERPFGGKTWMELAANVLGGRLRAPPKGNTVPSWLRQVCERGLALDPTERWPSMPALLEALAWNPAARRRRWLIAVGGFAAFAAVGFSGYSWASARARRCSGAETQLAGVWDEGRRAEVEMAILGTGLSYATSVWERAATELDDYGTSWASMYTEACEATTVRGEQSSTVMDLRMACLQQAKIELGAVTGVLADADADVVERAHELTAGLRPLSRCGDIEALQADVQPPGPEEVEVVRDVRVRLAQAKALHDAGRYPAAQIEIDAIQQYIGQIEYGPVHTEAEFLAGINLKNLGKLEASETALRHALELAARWRQLDLVQEASTHLMHVIGSKQSRMVEGLQYRELALGLAANDPQGEASVLTAIATVLQRQGKHHEAEVEYRRSLVLIEQALGPDDFEVAMIRNNLANVLSDQGRYEEAEAEHRRVLAMREQALGPEHPEVAMSRSNLANVLRKQGRYADAEVELRRAMVVQEQVLDPNHPDAAMVHNGLGNVLLSQGKYRDAERELRLALSAMEQTLGPDHPDVATVRSNLANALYLQSEHGEAAEQYRRALVSMENALGPKHATVGIVLGNLANISSEQGEHEQAAAEYQRSISIVEEGLGADHPHVAGLRSNYGEILHDLGRDEDAESEHRRVLEQRERTLGPEHHLVARSRILLGEALQAQGRHEEAETELRLALTELEAALEAEHPHIAMARVRLAALLLERGRAAETRDLAERAWARRKRDDTPGHERAEAAFVLARALLATDPAQHPRARELAQLAVDAWTEAGDAYADEAGRARTWLRELGGP